MQEPNGKSVGTLKLATFVFWILVTAIPIVGLALSVAWPTAFYAKQEQWRAFAASYPSTGPLLFILLQLAQVVIAPLSHYSVGYMGGFLYGTWYGGLLNYIGRVLGHVCAFWLSRLIGRPIAHHFVTPKALQTYDKYVSNRVLTLFLIYFLPLFPDDEISYLVGLSKMQFRWFLLANIFGHVGGSLSLAYMGSGINTKDALFWILTLVTLAGFPALWLLHKRALRRQALGSTGVAS